MAVSHAKVEFQLEQIRKQLLRSGRESNQTLAAIQENPAKVLTLASLPPDQWQTKLLQCSAQRLLVLASRQAGKSTASAALAVHEALVHGGLVLLLSPSQRQSVELFRKAVDLLNALQWPVAPALESLTRVELVNGARIVSLPGNESTARGFSAVSLLVIDEAARVPDELYRAVRPMLAVSGGRMVAVSTPWCKMGWFYDSWVSGSEAWKRFQVMATDCKRIPPDFLENERAELGERVYQREYGCEFMDSEGGIFSGEDVARTLADNTVQPLEI